MLASYQDSKIQGTPRDPRDSKIQGTPTGPRSKGLQDPKERPTGLIEAELLTRMHTCISISTWSQSIIEAEPHSDAHMHQYQYLVPIHAGRRILPLE